MEVFPYQSIIFLILGVKYTGYPILLPKITESDVPNRSLTYATLYVLVHRYITPYNRNEVQGRTSCRNSGSYF